MSTDPDSISYPPQPYGVLAPVPGTLIDVVDMGADPTGNDDSSDALQAAIDELPAEGGGVVLSPGVYKFSRSLVTRSNVAFFGPGTLKAAPQAEWAEGSPYRGIVNENASADVLTDENLTFDGVTIDFSDMTAADGTDHVIRIRRATRVVVRNCTIIGGASSVALPGCDDALEIGNRYLDFYNCGSDAWDNPSNRRVIGNHIETLNASQMVNFNPEPSDLVGTGHVADGFVFVGNTVISREVSGTACQIEPLATGNTVKNVTISGNRFVNTHLVLRGDVQGAVISGNTFGEFQGTTGVITADEQFSVASSGMVVTGNTINGPLTASPSVAVIYVESDSALITGNAIMGTSYSRTPISVGSTAGQFYGNYIENAGLQGTVGQMQLGFRMQNGETNFVGWLDTNDNSSRMYMTTSDAWTFTTRDASGNRRTVMDINAVSDTSSLRVRVPLGMDGIFYQKASTGLTATGATSAGALLLTSNFNEVSTTAAGTGVRIGNQSFYGGRFTVVNNGANTLKVYPTTGCTIDALATNAGFDLPAGSIGSWVFSSGVNFRTESIYP